MDAQREIFIAGAEKHGRGASDYTGRRFGALTVLRFEETRNGVRCWRCRCDCGREVVVGQTHLTTGNALSCGYAGKLLPEDLTGVRFGHLTVLGRAGVKSGRVQWACRCDCGRLTTAGHYNLLSGRSTTCGCRRAGVMIENLRLSEGTSVAKLERTRDRHYSSNTSGHNGVYQNKRSGKWVAQITFKGKTHYLGVYADKADAIKARLRGEEMYDEFLARYHAEHPQERS